MPRQSQYDANREALLRMIRGAQISHGRPPSVRGLAADLGVGVATVHSYLVQLSGEGLVEWSVGRHRTLHCTERGLNETETEPTP